MQEETIKTLFEQISALRIFGAVLLCVLTWFFLTGLKFIADVLSSKFEFATLDGKKLFELKSHIHPIA